MTPVQVIGQPGSGKTRLVSKLAAFLVKMGLHVGTLKHSAHTHELDHPGKDTHMHRMAGAAPVAMVNGAMAAVYLPVNEDTPQYLLERLYDRTDMVLIEGWISGPYPKIEVWRSQIDRPPLFTQAGNVCGLVLDGPLEEAGKTVAHQQQLKIMAHDDIKGLAEFVMRLAIAGHPVPAVNFTHNFYEGEHHV